MEPLDYLKKKVQIPVIFQEAEVILHIRMNAVVVVYTTGVKNIVAADFCISFRPAILTDYRWKTNKAARFSLRLPGL